MLTAEGEFELMRLIKAEGRLSRTNYAEPSLLTFHVIVSKSLYLKITGVVFCELMQFK